ncbi:unnamed protein product [Musa acuminata var. zebrina]
MSKVASSSSAPFHSGWTYYAAAASTGGRPFLAFQPMPAIFSANIAVAYALGVAEMTPPLSLVIPHSSLSFLFLCSWEKLNPTPITMLPSVNVTMGSLEYS